MRRDILSIKHYWLLPLVVMVVMLSNGNAASETLQEAWDIAISVDRSLKASKENTNAAESGLKAAKSAYIPNVVLKAGYASLSQDTKLKSDLLGQSLEIPLSQQNSGSYSTMATMPLYTGGSIESTIDASNALFHAAKLNENFEAQNLKLWVASSFVDVLRAGRILKVIKRHVRSLEAHTRNVENLYRDGMVAKSDMLSARVALADAHQKALQAANGLDLANAAYNRRLRRPLDWPVSLEEDFLDLVEEDLSVLTERALFKRSELAMLDRQVEAMRHKSDAVRGENYPQVSVSGGFDFQENKYHVYNDQWLVVLGVKWNLFDGGSVRHRASEVNHQASALSLQRDELASIITLQVRQAWLDVMETRKRIYVTQSAIDEAEENLRVVRDRYANGLAIHTEVLDAETMRAKSESNNTHALLDAGMAGLRLKRAVGEI
ncbi:MAG: TolC family protein [Proteobacteria bacterium]|nr:TolC family protein [Pseudomonadota bacterium]